MVSKIITFIKSYIELCIWLLVFAVGIRFFETVLFSKNNFNFPLSALLNTEGLVYDISLYLRIGIFLLIIFVITCFLNEKITRMVTRILLSFLYNNYHYMPFLDSLSKKSLSWVNCFSVSPRTFGVLPALLGNSPIGVKGFIQQCPYNPEFQSLSKILIENRYTNNFFHGGKSSWIKMDMFSDINDLIYMNDDEWDQDIQEETAGSEWGYEDHLIYKQALRNINRKNNIPRLDIYLTNTTHSPWKHAKEKDFINSVRSKISQNNKLSDEEKKIILNRLDIYGAYAYSDWSLQQLIEDYQQRDDFKNTIFIITGDHHYNSKQFAGSFNYHVPLVIYSPMLKTSRKMEGVVSHRDITPTILSLLHNNFNIETPDEVAWLNTALDTSIHFNANTFSYLQAAHGTCEGIIYKNYLYSEGVLDELTEKGPQRIENPVPNIVKPLERLLTLYKNVDNYTVLNDALLRKEQSNNLQTTTILDIYDTISMGSYFATRSKLPVLEGPERRKQTLYFDNKKSFPVNFLNYSFSDDDVENLRISIAFKIYILEDTIGEGMNVGLKILKDNETVAYKSDYLNNFQSNSWYDYNYVISFNKDICKQITKGCNFKVYLYNNKCEGYIDDIQVKFLIEKNIDKK